MASFKALYLLHMFMLCVGIICLLFLSCNGNIIETEFEYEYYNKTIICVDGEDCELRCAHSYSCQYSKIICPDNYDCNIQFNVAHVADNAYIFAQNSNKVAILSTQQYASRYLDIVGPIQILNISCSYYSCAQGTIYGKNTTQIVASCNGYKSCSSMQLFVDSSSYVDISCPASYACESMKIYQQSPIHPSKTSIKCTESYSCRMLMIKSYTDLLQIDCATSDACRAANIYYEPIATDRNATILCGNAACVETNIYSSIGISNISVISDNSQLNLQFYCGINYYFSCHLQPSIFSNNMLCDDTHYCMKTNNQYDMNLNTIVILNAFDKYNKTIQCDPTYPHCSIYCIGRYSCGYSNILCLNSQNSMNTSCSIYCGYYGCSHSTITVNNISSLIIETKENYAAQYVTIIANYLDNIKLICKNSYSCQYISTHAMNIKESISMNCVDSYSCQYSNIQIMSNGNYYDGYTYFPNTDIDCYGSWSCRSSTINSNSGYLNIACNSDSANTRGCYAVSLYCPLSIVYENNTNVYCDIQCGKTDSCISLDVYAINGWNNVHVSSINDQYPSSTTMYCDPSYVASCSMQGHVNSNEWFCDQNEVCSNYRFDLSATHILATTDYQFYNKTIECELDKDCNIYCSESSSCMYGKIICSNMICNVYCDGENSCKYSHIMAQTSNTLNVYATNDASYSTIYAPSTLLYMECSNRYACRSQTIYATDTNEIYINCFLSDSCRSQTIYAENANVIHMQCIGSYACYTSELYQYKRSKISNGFSVNCNGQYSCNRATIHSQLPLNILCESDYSCSLANLYIPYNESFELACATEKSCNDINIYSLNGFINSKINITSNLDSYSNTAKFHCGHGFTNFCTLNGIINSNQWICSDINNYCYDFLINETDTNYVLLNYDFEYVYNYIKCDQNKTKCHVICNSQYACWNSKIICPVSRVNNHSMCSVYCSGLNSCSFLQIYANSYSQVTFDCNGNNAFCSGITIYCTPQFNRTCIMNNNNECIGFCSNYTNNNIMNVNGFSEVVKYYPNNSYIITSYEYEYYNDTISCLGDIHN
eukprot:248252_1